MRACGIECLNHIQDVSVEDLVKGGASAVAAKRLLGRDQQRLGGTLRSLPPDYNAVEALKLCLKAAGLTNTDHRYVKVGLVWCTVGRAHRPLCCSPWGSTWQALGKLDVCDPEDLEFVTMQELKNAGVLPVWATRLMRSFETKKGTAGGVNSSAVAPAAASSYGPSIGATQLLSVYPGVCAASAPPLQSGCAIHLRPGHRVRLTDDKSLLAVLCEGHGEYYPDMQHYLGCEGLVKAAKDNFYDGGVDLLVDFAVLDPKLQREYNWNAKCFSHVPLVVGDLVQKRVGKPEGALAAGKITAVHAFLPHLFTVQWNVSGVPEPCMEDDLNWAPQCVIPAPNQDKFSFDVFLSHCWLDDSIGRHTHTRVIALAERLEQHGLKPWIDAKHMAGHVHQAIVAGIDQSAFFVACITAPYLKKVNGSIGTENCQLEFNYITSGRGNHHMLAVVMDPGCTDFRTWGGIVQLQLGPQLHVRAVDDALDSCVKDICTQLSRRLPPESPTARRAQTALNQFAAHVATPPTPLLSSLTEV